MTNTETQAAYRQRMYEKGFKQMRIWVPRHSGGKTVKAERLAFVKQLEALTAGWTKKRLAALFGELLALAKKRAKEVKAKK